MAASEEPRAPLDGERGRPLAFDHHEHEPASGGVPGADEPRRAEPSEEEIQRHLKRDQRAKRARVRSPLLAFALGVTCPGLGHLYAGSWGFAVAAFVLVTAAYAVPIAFVAFDGSLLVMLGAWGAAAVLLWGLQGWHAARLAKRRRPTGSLGAPRLLGYGAFVLAIFFLNSALGQMFEDEVLASYLPTSESMMPTLAPDDRYLVTKLLPGDTDPERGDVIVFRAPTGADEDWVKRAIGRPGDHLAFDEGWLTMNGVAARYEDCEPDEEARLAKLAPDAVCFIEVLPSGERHPIAREAGVHPPYPHMEFVVPEGHVFVLGDNRDRSVDSRFLGPIRMETILGRAHTIWRRADPEQRFADIGRVP